jgi:hypothetical protein
LEILKTQIPTKLDLIGSVQVPTEIYDAAIHDNTLYLATKYGGLTIIDTSEPENLSVMGDLLLDSGACSVDIEQQLAVLRPCKSYPASALIQLVDIGNVSFPELKESIEVPGIGYQAVVNNANLYADWNSYIFGDAQSDETTAGINAWSLNEESEASLIAVHEMDKVPTNLLLDSGMLFVAWSHAWPFYDETECVGMDIYFVSDPDSWELVGTVSVDSWKPWRVLERYGDYIVAGTMLQDDTYVIDINDLYNPVVFGPIEIENVWDMQATHGHAFVVDKVELSIWSGANPLEPQLVEVLDPTPGWSRSLAVSHGYMFAESGGIASFDVRGCWAE